MVVVVVVMVTVAALTAVSTVGIILLFFCHKALSSLVSAVLTVRTDLCFYIPQPL